MDNIRVRCGACNKELESISGKTVCCGCPNMTSLRGDRISAKDMGQVIMLNYPNKTAKEALSNQDLMWQEERRKRKVRRLDFEIR